jgi:hypothetical protein
MLGRIAIIIAASVAVGILSAPMMVWPEEAVGTGAACLAGVDTLGAVSAVAVLASRPDQLRARSESRDGLGRGAPRTSTAKIAPKHTAPPHVPAEAAA